MVRSARDRKLPALNNGHCIEESGGISRGAGPRALGPVSRITARRRRSARVKRFNRNAVKAHGAVAAHYPKSSAPLRRTESVVTQSYRYIRLMRMYFDVAHVTRPHVSNNACTRPFDLAPLVA